MSDVGAIGRLGARVVGREQLFTACRDGSRLSRTTVDFPARVGDATSPFQALIFGVQGDDRAVAIPVFDETNSEQQSPFAIDGGGELTTRTDDIGKENLVGLEDLAAVTGDGDRESPHVAIRHDAGVDPRGVHGVGRVDGNRGECPTVIFGDVVGERIDVQASWLLEFLRVGVRPRVKRNSFGVASRRVVDVARKQDVDPAVGACSDPWFADRKTPDVAVR
ncbi:MAG: hypothetical protein EB018_00415 [Gammaproteobacteria bacterium]|nr:hypothetical protein [Gammaproteobacteria bacterium]